MDPSSYVPAYLERSYFAEHPDLTPAARELVHDDVWQRPEKYATTPHAQALLAYARTHAHLMSELNRMADLPDEEFERKRGQLFDETRLALYKIAQTDHLVVDAHLVGAMLADTPLDACISDLMKIEARTREHLENSGCGFDIDAPGFWTAEALDATGLTEAQLTQSDPMAIGWLHTLEAISQLCLATARYKAAASYARCVMRAQGYPSHAEGTVMLALARLEDEDGFFSFVRELGTPENAAEGSTPEAPGQVSVDDSPWFLLARTLLLFKAGRERPARRALRDFSERCEGGAFFLLNPTYIDPYLPVRPQVREPWELTHQAVWEAEGAVYDTPDFVPWAETVEGIYEASEAFAERHGF